MPKLTDKKVKALKSKGEHLDGAGLFLRVTEGGAKSWYLRTAIHGRVRKIGLGSAEHLSLAEARIEAANLRAVARRGGDPIAERKREIMTFEQAARRVHAALVPTWRNQKHAESWFASIANYAFPTLGARRIDTIGTADVLGVISPIWTTMPETASRIKQRLAAIFDWAKAAGHYPHENPVNGLKRALPTVKRRPEHLAALSWREVPDFMRELGDRSAVSARALEFIILTAARSGEARGARWAEIDGDVWTVPGDRMKRGLPHRVPLSEAALGVLEAVRGLDGDLVFPSPSRDAKGRARALSVMGFKPLLNRMEREGFTVHGFRSAFRDWCSESARAPREVAEAALSHATGDAVERAYARSDLIAQRRELMEAWGRFVTGKTGDVVQLVRA
jgi:integrase